MRIITGFIFIANIALWIAGIVLSFSLDSLAGIIASVSFLIFLVAWKISGETVTAPADYFFQPEWEVFVTKLKWANSVGLTPVGIIIILTIAVL